ncbi:MAG: NAD-dependent epimerase/dehydratase family protein [Bacteroidetes bacterium]|nr:MAG: NAD-dependent epimerase/dehydratase family protein [Bacteroidota bacterium]
MIFLTGGDGLLGSNLVRELLARDYELKVLVQPGRTVKTLEGLPIQRVEGDLLDAEGLLRASEGCSHVIHAAAITDVWPPKGDIFFRVNLEGTQNVLAAVRKHGIEKMVYVGSGSSFVPGTKAQPGTEAQLRDRDIYGLDYIESKLQAHRLIQQVVQEEGLPISLIAPTFMIGPYDAKPGPGTILLAAATGTIPGYTAGGRNWVHVRDVAQGICLALEKAPIGSEYIMGHANLSYQEAFAVMGEVMGVNPPRLAIPKWASLTGGAFGSAFGKLTGRSPKISMPVARVSVDEHYFSPAKAVRELGLPQTPFAIAVEDAYRWFVDNGYVDRK